MKEYILTDVIEAVRVCIEDNTQTPAGLIHTIGLEGDLTYNETDQIIRDSLIEAIKILHESADVSLVEGVKCESSPVANSDGSGSVQKPVDFLRLVRFKMKGWKTSVTGLITEDSPRYILQKNKYQRGNPTIPVCALCGNVIEYYSLRESTDHQVEVFSYLPIPAIKTGEGGIEVIGIEKLLYNDVILLCGAYTLLKLKDDGAQSLLSMASIPIKK